MIGTPIGSRESRALPLLGLVDGCGRDESALSGGMAQRYRAGQSLNVHARSHHREPTPTGWATRLEEAVKGVNDWATGQQNLLGELDLIRQQILNGTFPPLP